MASHFLLSLITGIFIGVAAAYLGSLMLSKRMALVAGPLGHLTLPGIALAIVYGFDMSLGAFPFVILGIILIWLFEARTKLPVEALTAVVFASGVATAFLFLPIGKAEAALVGDIAKVGFIDGIVAMSLSALVFLVARKIYSKMTLIDISEDLAKVEGVNVKKYNLLYLACIAVIVALGVKLVGGLLTVALIAIPAATARNVSGELSQYQFLSGLFGFLSCFFGVLLFEKVGLPAGPLIILVSTLFFLISAAFKR